MILYVNYQALHSQELSNLLYESEIIDFSPLSNKFSKKTVSYSTTYIIELNYIF